MHLLVFLHEPRNSLIGFFFCLTFKISQGFELGDDIYENTRCNTTANSPPKVCLISFHNEEKRTTFIAVRMLEAK